MGMLEKRAIEFIHSNLSYEPSVDVSHAPTMQQALILEDVKQQPAKMQEISQGFDFSI